MDDNFVNGLANSFQRQIAALSLQIAEAHGRIAQLESENAKLKEPPEAEDETA